MQISEIKSQLPIATVLDHYNIRVNKNHHAKCPFHQDSKPSLRIYPKTNTYTCFGCDKTGDTIQFIQDIEKTTKRQAILKAKELIGTAIKPHKMKTANQENQEHQEHINFEALFPTLKQQLHRSKKAIAYLESRGIYDVKLAQGYKPQGGSPLFKGMNNCIIYPLRNAQNKIVSFYGRALNNKTTSGHYYTAGREGLYPNYPSRAAKVIILTESIIDAATLIKYLPSQLDYEILALYGTNGFTAEHKKALQQLENLQEIILWLDGDAAGSKATAAHATTLHALLPTSTISKADCPEGEDINSLVQSHDPAILGHLIQEKTTLFVPAGKTPIIDTHDQASENPQNPENPTIALDTTNREYLKWRNYNLNFTIIGGVGLYPLDRLKVTLRIKRQDSDRPIHSLRQTIDLYQDELLEKLARKLAERLEIGSSKVHESLLALTGLLENYREAENEKRKKKEIKIRTLTPQRIATAKAYLTAKQLDKRTRESIAKTGLVGEEKNGMTLWYVFTSRLRKQPLHAMCLGASGTGKTYLQEKIGALIPKHQKKEITAMSDNAMYYFDEKELVHKLLLIEDLDGANEQKILYALRELMSKKYISKTIVIKDSKGNLKTITLEVRGPICLAGTTTRERLYEDNSNRSLLIYLDNSAAQRARIMTYQRKESAGKIDKEAEAAMVEFLQDVQSVLQPIRVVNPYAEQLIIPEQVFKPLRTNSHYLQFIESVTFYHQYQREKQYDSRGKAYIATTIEDIEIANELLKDILLAKSDELTKAARHFYEQLKAYTKKEEKDSFYSGEVRKKYRMTPPTIGRHLKTLVKYGYVKIVGGNKRSGYEYEINEEIKDLKTSIYSALDEVLNRIKQAEKGKNKPS